MLPANLKHKIRSNIVIKHSLIYLDPFNLEKSVGGPSYILFWECRLFSLSFYLSITTVGLQGFIFPDQSSDVLIPAQLTSNFRPNPIQALTVY